MDDPYKTGLYRWQRQMKPKVQSRSHKVTTSDDIQDWIKKVEAASDKAADVAFGLLPAGKQRAKVVAEHHVGRAREQEQALTEAQDLLNQWVTDNLHFGDDDRFDDLKAWRRARAENKSKNNANSASEEFRWEAAYDVTVDDDLDIDEAAIYERVKRMAIGDEDPYADLYKMEDGDAVTAVLNTMMRKQVVKDNFKKDLGFNEEKKPDPRVKMELRHKMVKENREKRQMEEGKKKMEQQMKKEARLKAQQLILKEQRDREARARKEEVETRKEMTKIRKQLQEDLRRKEEERRRDWEEREELDRLAREELKRQEEREEREAQLSHRQESERRKHHMVKMEMFRVKMATKNRKILHHHFTAWYDLVVSHRLLMGKVKAMRDWKLMVRVWGSWRSYVRGRQLEMETEVHERNLIDAQRKHLTAQRHHTLSILRRCLSAWKVFVDERIEMRELQQEQERTRNKMASLLNAVAEGKLAAREDVEEERKRGGRGGGGRLRQRNDGYVKKSERKSNPIQQSIDSQKLDQMFQQPVRQAWAADTESLASSRSDLSLNPNALCNPGRPASVVRESHRGTPVPTEAWQVTRQHLKLTKNQIANLANDPQEDEMEEGGQRHHTDVAIRKRFGTQPWMKRHYTVNNFEHRYNAQQQALKEQRDQIREQQRMIEDLQSHQRQQSLRQRLSQGAGTLPPSPEIPPVVSPPHGQQIPRNDAEKQMVNARGFVNVTQEADGPKPKQGTLTPECTELETQRTDLLTDRSEQSSITNVTSTTTTIQHTHNSKYLKVLKNMEDRAAERARLKAERGERRRIQEEQKLAKLQRQEEERLKEIEAEKKARAEAYRQKKRVEKQKEEEKKRQKEKEVEQMQRADHHYLRSLMKYKGLLPFKKLISQTKRNEAKASKHRARQLLRHCVDCWKSYTQEELTRKQSMADQMHQFLMTKHTFSRWRQHKNHQEFLERRAQRHHATALRLKAFHHWLAWLAQEREKSLCCMEQAQEHYLKSLVKKTFQAWRYLPQRLKREEERQKKKLEMRKKVAQLIPDFEPAVSVTVDASEEIV